jgi:hypothetical protein
MPWYRYRALFELYVAYSFILKLVHKATVPSMLAEYAQLLRWAMEVLSQP